MALTQDHIRLIELLARRAVDELVAAMESDVRLTDDEGRQQNRPSPNTTPSR